MSETRALARAHATASTAISLLDTAISIIGRFRDASPDQNDVSTVLRKHTHELSNLRSIIQIVMNEAQLQTAAVTSALVEVKAIEEVLFECLSTSEGEGSPIDHSQITSIMGDLSRAREFLVLRIRYANVGLTHTAEGRVVANAAVIDRIDRSRSVQQTLGEGLGLNIAGLLKSRSPEDNGMVPLNLDDIASLSKVTPWIDSDDSAKTPTPVNSARTRIVVDNMAHQGSLQINGPIGVDGWLEVGDLEIRSNSAEGRAIQVNHAISMEIFKRLLDYRGGDASTKHDVT